MSYKDTRRGRQMAQIHSYLDELEQDQPDREIMFRGIIYTIPEIRERIQGRKDSVSKGMLESLLVSANAK